jgi:hypothetical protein
VSSIIPTPQGFVDHVTHALHMTEFSDCLFNSVSKFNISAQLIFTFFSKDISSLLLSASLGLSASMLLVSNCVPNVNGCKQFYVCSYVLFSVVCFHLVQFLACALE